MKMERSGKTKVVIYGGHLANSGKTILNFGGHKLNFIDKVADKSALLVHNETKAILQAYPRGTNRGDILDNLANNIDKLNHFISCPEQYELVDKVNLQTKKEDAVETKYDVYKEPSYSTQGNYSHLNKRVKKSYNLNENNSW